jgi:hypothetical protein
MLDEPIAYMDEAGRAFSIEDGSKIKAAFDALPTPTVGKKLLPLYAALPSGAEPVAYEASYQKAVVVKLLTYNRDEAEYYVVNMPNAVVRPLYACPQSSSQVTEERFPVTLGKVHEAIDGYVQALVDRKHGGVALDHAFGAICDALGRSTTAELDARRAALSPVKGDGQ